MNNKFYVSLEVEELLKEKKYPFVWGYDSIHPRKVTKAEAIDWLDSKGFMISPHPVTILRKDSTIEIHWSCNIVQKGGAWYTTNDLPTRLEAEEAAIIKACKLLKNGN